MEIYKHCLCKTIAETRSRSTGNEYSLNEHKLIASEVTRTTDLEQSPKNIREEQLEKLQSQTESKNEQDSSYDDLTYLSCLMHSQTHH